MIIIEKLSFWYHNYKRHWKSDIWWIWRYMQWIYAYIIRYKHKSNYKNYVVRVSIKSDKSYQSSQTYKSVLAANWNIYGVLKKSTFRFSFQKDKYKLCQSLVHTLYLHCVVSLPYLFDYQVLITLAQFGISILMHVTIKLFLETRCQMATSV